MSQFARAFCNSSQAPTLNTVKDTLAAKGVHLAIICDSSEELDSTTWNYAQIHYQDKKLPILIECNRISAEPKNLANAEIQEFLEKIGSPGLWGNKKRVSSHLKKTRFIVSCQIPISDINPIGENIVEEFLAYFVVHCNGLFQADGSGFFEGQNCLWSDT